MYTNSLNECKRINSIGVPLAFVQHAFDRVLFCSVFHFILVLLLVALVFLSLRFFLIWHSMLFNQQAKDANKKRHRVETEEKMEKWGGERENLCNEMLYTHNFTRVFLFYLTVFLLCRLFFVFFFSSLSIHWPIYEPLVISLTVFKGKLISNGRYCSDAYI